jgi:hypothetical protein
MPTPRPVTPTLAGLRAATPSARDGEKLKDVKTAALTPSLVGARSAARAQAASQSAAPAMAPLNPPMPVPRPQKAASAGKSRAN